MRINKSGYDSMDWMAALSKSKQPIKDQEAHLLSKIGKEEDIENALEKAASAAFSLPSKDVSGTEAIAQASKAIQDEGKERQRVEAVGDVKKKLANHDIDPVALGVVSKETWETCSDVEAANQIAIAAAEKAEQNRSREWQARAMAQKNPKMVFDPETTRSGKISSTAAEGEDSAPVITRQSPANAPSIFDPFKLDKLQASENAHDEAQKGIRSNAQARKEAAKDWRMESVPQDFVPLNRGSIQRSGGHDAAVFSSKVPANQVSMMDNVDAKTPEEAKEKMKKLFESKVQDNGQKIRESNKARSESIHRQVKKDDKSWEAVSKPTSTKDLQQRLMNLWMPPEPSK